MAGQKKLLKTLEVSPSGKLHKCKSNAKHPLVKGQLMLIVKNTDGPSHHCPACGLRFVDTARLQLAVIEKALRG